MSFFFTKKCPLDGLKQATRQCRQNTEQRNYGRTEATEQNFRPEQLFRVVFFLSFPYKIVGPKYATSGDFAIHVICIFTFLATQDTSNGHDGKCQTDRMIIF